MKVLSKIAVPLFMGLWVLFSACPKPKCDDPAPTLTYVDFIQYEGDSGKLICSFTDCDGDIGLTDADTSGDYRWNFFVNYFEKQCDTCDWIQWDTCPVDPPFCLQVPYFYRIPIITPQGKDKGVEGDIEISVLPRYFSPFAVGQKVKFEAYLQDRNLNKSNVITTPEIIVPTN